MKGIILLLAIGIVAGAPVTPDPSLCQVCHLLLGQVQTHVKQGRTQVTLLDYETTICNGLPTDEKDACKQFVGENSDTFFQKLIADLTPYQFCDSLDVCSVIPVEEPAVLEQNDEPENVEGIVECELCKLAVLAVDKLLVNNRSAAAINDTLEKFCASLPDKIAATCKTIEPLIIKGVEDGLDPEVACKVATLCAVPGSNSDISLIPCDVCYTSLDAIGLQDPERVCSELKTCMREAEMAVEEKPVEVQDDFECQLCKFVVQAVDQLVGENRSAAAINVTLRDLCSDLPGELKDACMNVEPDIVKAIIGGIDPSVACEFIKACQDSIHVPVSSDFIPCDVCKETLEAVAGERGVKICHTMPMVCGPAEPEPEPEQTTTPVCLVCQFVTKSIADLLQTDQSRGAISATMEHVCDQLPEAEQTFCTKHGDYVVDYMTEGGRDPIKGCIAISVCEELEEIPPMVEEVPKMVEKIPPMVEPIMEEPKATPECDTCKFVITFLDQFLEDNVTIEKLNSTLFEVCGLIPEAFKTMCLNLIPQVEKILDNGFNPETTCSAIGLCSNESDAVPQMFYCDLCDIMLDQQESTEEVTKACHVICPRRQKRSIKQVVSGVVSQMERTVKAKADYLEGVDECEFCELLIKTIDVMIGDDKTDEKINATIFTICSDLAGQQLVQICYQEAPKIIDLMKQGLNPHDTCVVVSLCQAARDEHKLQKRSLKEKTTSKSSNLKDIKCEICEFVIKEVDTILGENATFAKINETVYAMCDKIPGAANTECLKIAPTIVSELAKGVDPQAACTAVKLCTATEGQSVPKKLKVAKPENLKDIKCEICEFVIKEVDTILGENATFAKINETVYGLCERIPGAAKAECDKIAPTIVSALAQGVDPQTACTAARLCTSTGSEATQLDVQVTKVENLKDIKCEICEFVIKEVDTILGENATFAKINETVYGLCERIPGAAKAECDKIAPTIVSALAQGVDPETACTAARLCTSTDEVAEVKLMGTGNLKDIKCDICEFLIDEVDRIIGQNASHDKINSTVYGLCERVSGTVKELCLEIAPTIVNALSNGVDPKMACSLVKLCTSTDITIISKLKEKYEDKANLADIKCEICEFIINEIDQVVEKNSSAATINATVFGVCDKLPKTVQNLCYQSAPAIVQAVERGVDAKNICSDIRLCTAAGAETDVKVKASKKLDCSTCMRALQPLHDDWSENYEKVRRTMLKMCHSLPAGLRPKCATTVSNDNGVYYKLFLERYTPSLLCEMAQCVENNVPVTKGNNRT